MVRAVALGTFLPDASRSGYFPERAGRDHPDPEPLSDSSSEGSADEEFPNYDMEENAFESLEEWEPIAGLRDRLQGVPLFRHVASRMIHICESEEGSLLKCGRKISTSYEAVRGVPRMLHPMCKQCCQ